MATKHALVANKCPFETDQVKLAQVTYLGMTVGEKALFDPALGLTLTQASHLHLQWEGELICETCDQIAEDIKAEIEQ